MKLDEHGVGFLCTDGAKETWCNASVAVLSHVLTKLLLSLLVTTTKHGVPSRKGWAKSPPCVGMQ